MKKLDLKQMEKVNGGDCWGLLMRAGNNISNGAKFDRLIKRYERRC